MQHKGHLQVTLFSHHVLPYLEPSLAVTIVPFLLDRELDIKPSDRKKTLVVTLDLFPID